MTINATEQVEGKATFKVGNAFFRTTSQVARDLGVLAAATHQAKTNRLRVLDVMAGCGVRSLRYWLEAQADWVWTNEGNPDISPTLQHNLARAIATGHGQLTHLDANRVFFDCYNRSDYYDLVDVDCFGSAAPYLSTSLWAIALGGLLYLTSTDGRTATGHLPNGSLQVYSAYARSHPAAHEQGLRLLIGSVQQQAASRGFGVEPVFSLFLGQSYRVMLRLVATPALTAQNYGFLGYCHHCGNYQTIDWRKLGRAICLHDQKPLTLSGPMWLGSLHHPRQLQQYVELAAIWGWPDRISLLNLMKAEAAMPPYFYQLGEVGRRGKLDIPKRSQLIQTLQDMGYRASATHITAQAIKTDADIRTCILAARQC
ncbi:tRNA (guanine-N1)-methyltransferase [Oculatella sp. LEGE 06141]|uniref:tRNA (guanine-N1)-methyltransferase n=1 Tax=Oculatella sp. LEGE 06141 TaxID=1828648 RepID=UPI00188206B3|nr:tRNA (guanine-N1)-methyltransferase [Oculatella sp. LEGE 06141]MBE9179901.1 tRNA (guanine-N1)-methyltransferase [Oculatella sp. LEGE 06141]